MKKYVILALCMLMIFVYGCVEGLNENTKMVTDDLKELLDTDENIEIQLVYLNKDKILDQIDVLNKVCNNVIQKKGYYKLRKRHIDEDISDIYYIDPETNSPVCKIKAILKPAEGIEKEEPEKIEETETSEIDLKKARNLLLEYTMVEGTKLSSKRKNELEDVGTGDDIEVKVKLYPRIDFDNLNGMLKLRYADGKIYDTGELDLEDMEVNESITRKVYLDLPEGTDRDFTLELVVSDSDGDIIIKEYDLEVEARAANVKIYRIEPSPEGTILAGKVLGIDIRLKNSGSKDAKNLNLTAEIEKLNLLDSITIDELEKDSSENYDLFFRVPSGTDENTYRVDIVLVNEDGEQIDADDFRINVEE